MTAQEFFQLAETSISNDPKDRLPEGIKERLGALGHTSDQMLFDVHAHCFTIDNVPKGFMNIGWLRGIPSGLDIAAFVFKLIATLKRWTGGKNTEYYEAFGRRRFLANFTKKHGSSDGILMHQFNRYNYAFDNILKRPKPHIFIVQLMMDMERGISGRPDKPFYEQWKELSDLRGQRQHDKSILPFLAVDPRNPNVYKDFLAAFSDRAQRINRTGQAFLDTAFPFFGVKIYPSLGYMPSDPVLMDIFKVCAAKKIPVLTHCGGAATRFSGDRIKGQYYASDGRGGLTLNYYTLDLKGMPKSEQGPKISDFFNAPYNWLAVAEAYPDLKINLAHFGGSREWDDYRAGQAHTHIHETMTMVAKFPNVFADISYAYSRQRNLEKIAEMLYSEQFSEEQRAVFKDKFLHGTDYFMTDQEKSLITMVSNLYRRFDGDQPLLDRICVHNPLRYLLQ
jgi:predicted TIM-barrel fold metal-dependent hydrolase